MRIPRCVYVSIRDCSHRVVLMEVSELSQVPVSSIAVGDGHALNKMAWDRKDGKHVALGGSDGNLSVYDIGETSMPKDSEWSDLQRTVQGMLQQGGSGMAR